jgi:hypothetical protein
VSLYISSVCLNNAGLPTSKPRDSALVDPVFFANPFGANLFGLFYYRQRLFFAKAAWFARNRP